jgi:hypothetical protein
VAEITTETMLSDQANPLLIGEPLLPRHAPGPAAPRLHPAMYVLLGGLLILGVALVAPRIALVTPFPAGILAIYCLVSHLHAERLRARLLWRAMIGVNLLIAVASVGIYLFN